MNQKIIIIGAGVAGLSAALQAVSLDCKVILVSSYPSERAQSVMAEGGINAALNTKNEGDDCEKHFLDTLHSACGLADPNAVWNMTQAAPGIVLELQRLGVSFNTNEDGEIDLRHFGGQKLKRTAYAKSETGKQIMTALIDAVRQKEYEDKVIRLSHHSFQTLLYQNNTCYGCIIKDLYTHTYKELYGNAVIMATGGLNGLFGNTTGSWINTAEASAELFRLGVTFSNLEMIQFHPTTIERNNKRMLISEAARAEGGRLFAYRENKPWYFMEEKYPLGNLMPRDITSREIFRIAQKNTVYLDMTNISKAVIDKKLSSVAEDCLTYMNIDICKEPIPIYPGIHYFMGGIDVDENHHTSMHHLFAAGECCSQYHGANRLGGNSLLAAIYGGKTAAQTACQEKQDFMLYPKKVEIPTKQTDYEKKNLHHIMLNTMTVERNENTLKKGLIQLEEMCGNLSLLGRAMIQSALVRKESRGAHFRSDYPERNDELFNKMTLAKYNDNKILIDLKKISKRKKNV